MNDDISSPLDSWGIVALVLGCLLRKDREYFAAARRSSKFFSAAGAAAVATLATDNLDLPSKAYAIFTCATGIILASQTYLLNDVALAKVQALFKGLPHRFCKLVLDLRYPEMSPSAVSALQGSDLKQRLRVIHVHNDLLPNLADDLLSLDAPFLRSVKLKVVPDPLKSRDIIADTTWSPTPPAHLLQLELIYGHPTSGASYKLDVADTAAASGLQELRLSGPCTLINHESLSELSSMTTLVDRTLGDSKDWAPVICHMPLLQRAELPLLSLPAAGMDQQHHEALAELTHLEVAAITFTPSKELCPVLGLLSWLMPALPTLTVGQTSWLLLAALSGHGNITTLDLADMAGQQEQQEQQQQQQQQQVSLWQAQPIAHLSKLTAHSMELPSGLHGVFADFLPALQEIAVTQCSKELLAALSGHASIASLDLDGLDHGQAVQLVQQPLLPTLPSCSHAKAGLVYISSSKETKEAVRALLADAAGSGAVKDLHIRAAAALAVPEARLLASSACASLRQLHLNVSSMGLCALALLLQGQLQQLRRLVLTCGVAPAVTHSLEQDKRDLGDLLRGHSSAEEGSTAGQQLQQLVQAFADSQGLAEGIAAGLLGMLHAWRDEHEAQHMLLPPAQRVPEDLPVYQPKRSIVMLLNRLRARLGLQQVDVPGQGQGQGLGLGQFAGAPCDGLPVMLGLPEAQALQLVAVVEAGLVAREVALAVCDRRIRLLAGSSLVVEWGGCVVEMPL
jgi:hypothetical protein